jgi:hypothetical protein
MKDNKYADRVTVRCPFCEKLFLMPRPLFKGERELTACPSCRAEAIANTEQMTRCPNEN